MAAMALSSGCSRSTFIQNPYEAISRSSPEKMAQIHQPEALHADLDAIVALHERTNPNPYLRVSKASIAGQLEINKAEAANPNPLTSGWRPFIGWVCGAGFALQFVVGPL
ncbi:MAG: 3TM-type holin, partial [Betaproteobacteria bacterium]